jgi:hypothetical protein
MNAKALGQCAPVPEIKLESIAVTGASTTAPRLATLLHAFHSRNLIMHALSEKKKRRRCPLAKRL